MQVAAWKKTDVGCVRAHNEDACFTCVEDDMSLGIVCDGMGGANAGEVASQLAIDSFAQTLLQALSAPAGGSECPPEEQLRYALERANQSVYCYGWEHPECRGMGTTIVATLVLESTAYILNVGDSRAYALRGCGIRQITQDHSLVGELLRAGRITPEQARNHPRKNIITRALGTERHIAGDLFVHRLQSGERLLLCSDGLTNELTDSEIYELVQQDGPIEEGCQRLLNAALLRGAHDNVTAVLMDLQNSAER
ncbi:MAG: Stp1/IreP family PP2C-type Ser/Thr phosphatase [Clostridiales bacterium]|nr:Stp1/IreP family PP2C-type Ser/Thr phosphatase [Clostridiales bacterium]